MKRTYNYILIVEEDGENFNIMPASQIQIESYPRGDEYHIHRVMGSFIEDESPDAYHNPMFRAVEKALMYAGDLQKLEQESEKLQILLNKSKKQLMDTIFGDQ